MGEESILAKVVWSHRGPHGDYAAAVTNDPGIPRKKGRRLVTFSLQPAEGGTNLRLEHTGFASAGQAGLTIRDMLGKGWNSRVLREKLPALLNSQN